MILAMASPVKLLFTSLIFGTIGWILFVFAARLLAWFLSRILGASVGFRVAGWNCVRDVNLKFRKGAVESLSVGEFKLTLRKSLVKLGFSSISGDPKLQFSICDLELVLRTSERSTKPSERSTKMTKPKSKSKKSGSAGRGRWALLANIARFLSVSLTDFVLKVPKADIEIKDLRLDISKSGGSNPILQVKLYLIPLLVHICDSQLSFGPSSFDQGDCLLTGRNCASTSEKVYAPFICEDFSIACELGHFMDQGIKITNLDLTSGDISVDLNENLFSGTKSKSEVAIGAEVKGGATVDVTAAKKSQDNKLSTLLRKHIIPDKVSFNLPNLDVKFLHQGQGLSVQNNVMGVHLRFSKSILCDDSGDASLHCDIQMNFSEIHLLREGPTSVLEVLKVAIVASVDVPTQPLLTVRTEIDVKLGGTRCNLIVGRLKPLVHLHTMKKKKMVLPDERSHKERSQIIKPKVIVWTCTVSAPEVTIVLYGLNDLPLYHGCSQSSHLSANNIASKGVEAHAEVGELHLQVADEGQVNLRESLFSVEINPGSLLHVARVSLDLGHRGVESHEESDPNKWKLVCAVDITGVGVFLSFKHVESLVSTLMPLKMLLKSLSVSSKRSTQSKAGRSSKSTTKGTQILRLNLDKCSINYCGEMSAQDMIIDDPKRVNYGSQGGQTTITICADGTPRTATIISTVPSCTSLKFSASLDIFHLKLCLNKEKNSLQIDLERARSIYEGYSEENKPGANVTLLDMQNAKFVRRSSGLNEIAVCSLFNVTDIAVRWEPDVHLALFELITSLKSVVHKNKTQYSSNEVENIKDVESVKEIVVEQTQSGKNAKKREGVFAIDVEKLKVSAALADGVEVMISVQSIFSENAKIGVLLEELVLSFNAARLFKSSRMQISRIPLSVSGQSTDPKAQSTTTWDLVIQAPDVYICIPHRLELRAIDDAVEDTLRALKLIAAAKTSLIFPMKDSSKKAKGKSTTKLRSVRFIIRKLTVDIEEEPIQGWLDEHYQLMSNEVCELAVRLKLLDELILVGSRTSGGSEPLEMGSGNKFLHNGIEIDASDTSTIESLREEIHKQAFRSYYQACQDIVISEGSGACVTGFQSGFKPSTNRASLLLVCATELDVTLTDIERGDMGMIEFINKIDPVSLDNEIPFSRLYGRDISLTAGSLSVQIRNYTFPLFSATAGKCQGRLVLALQATCFQPQMLQDVYVGNWWKVRMLRSASGTTPAMKTYTDLPLHFHKAEVSFGVGYEPVFADISFVFTVALRRAFLGTRGPNPLENLPPKKERSLPWWDDMRYYIHGRNALYFSETRWNLLATTNPYEKVDKLKILSGYMEIKQSDGHVCLFAKELKAYLSSLESLTKNCSLKIPCSVSGPFLYCPALSVDIVMCWGCDSGYPLDHYLHALPKEGKSREIVFDPFRSTSLSLWWNISLGSSLLRNDEPAPSSGIGDSSLVDGSRCSSSQKSESVPVDSPLVNLGAPDLVWLLKFCKILLLPPHKLRFFSRWPRFGLPRIVRSGNLPLDRVMTEFFLRLDVTPTCIKHVPLADDDPASGLTIKMTKLKLEMCQSRGKQKFTFDCKRETLDVVYQCVDLHLLKVYFNRRDGASAAQDVQTTRISSQTVSAEKYSTEKSNYLSGRTEKCRDDGFLISSDYFTIRKQTPKADPSRLLTWQGDGTRNLEKTHARSEFENGSESDHTRSDLSDDDGFNVLVADNCQRIFVYGLKILWTLGNRDGVCSWVGGLAKAFAPPKPSPSRVYVKRKLVEEQQMAKECEVPLDDAVKLSPSGLHAGSSPPPQHVEALGTQSSLSPLAKEESSTNVAVNHGYVGDPEEDGTRHFMVNVIQPQFNLHSEEANGRFLLAAASGRVLARSFHSVLHAGCEMIEKAQALVTGDVSMPETEPEMTWKRVELSVMLEQVQAHVAPTDVDPGAGVQWLPKIRRKSEQVKRTGALLERVFTPCQMYFQYTRHKGGTPELKVKPLKELMFNSPDITAAMTSRQFQVMLDVLTNLLFARLPKPNKSSLLYPTDDDEDVEEEADVVVPDGVEEVELARINIEQRERERKLILDDIRALSVTSDICGDQGVCPENGELWMITGRKSALVDGLKKELSNIRTSRKAGLSALRTAMQKAAQIRLMEKEKNKSPSFAMRVSMKISKVAWSMLLDGKSFVEAEITDMIYDFDRDYKDIGVALFTTKSFILRNCLPSAKSDNMLSAWNAPPEWGKNVMLRVNARQGAPKDGNSLIELFQVEIYPLRIHLTESMYRMMWGYFFPGEEQDSQRRQEEWKVSTTAGTRRAKKNTSGHEATASTNQSNKESDIHGKSNAATAASVTAITSPHGGSPQVLKLPNSKGKTGSGTNPELRRTSSFDRTLEENVADSVANELVQSNISSKAGPLSSAPDYQHPVGEEPSKSKSKDSKLVRPGRVPEEKKVGKSQDEKSSRPQKMMEFRNIKISQIELLLTYEGSRLGVSDVRLLIDTFHRDDFTGTWRRLFSRIKKHVIWGVLKSVTGMQGKKFKGKASKAQCQREIPGGVVPETDLHLSDSDGGQPGKSDQLPVAFPKRPVDGAGDGFVTSVKGIFSTQRRKAKAFVLKTMKGEAEGELQGDESESDVEIAPFARQLTITKAKKLIKCHTKKYDPRTEKNPSGVPSQQQEPNPSSPKELSPFQSDSSDGSSDED